jgi:hypothetical protein
MLRNLALALVSFLVALLALEAGIRLSKFELGDWLAARRKFALYVEWNADGQYDRGTPLAHFAAGAIDYQYNSLGMRGPEPTPKRAGTTRIVTLGDSVTHGTGVAVEQTYPNQLAKLLADRPVEVVRVAMAGWNTQQELNCLRHNIDVFAPDVVVLLYVTNDNERLDPWEAARRSPPTFANRIYRSLVTNSRLFEWGAWIYTAKLKPADWESLRPLAQHAAERKAGGAPFSSTDPGWAESRLALEELVTFTRHRGAQLVIFAWNLGNEPPGPAMVASLQEFGAEFGVPVYDTSSLYTDDEPLSFWVLPFVDPHPNPRAHERLAWFIAQTLDQLGLLPPLEARQASHG